MSFLVTVSFDLKNASAQDYQNVDQEFSKIGLSRTIEGSTGKNHSLPDNTYSGEFEGSSVGKVRNDLADRVSEALRNAGVKSQVYIVVGGSWAWGIRYT